MFKKTSILVQKITNVTISIKSIKSLQNKVKTQPPLKGNYKSFIDAFYRVNKTNRMVYQKCISSKQTSPI